MAEKKSLAQDNVPVASSFSTRSGSDSFQVGDGLANNLMQVYESLTGSASQSTPPDVPAESSSSSQPEVKAVIHTSSNPTSDATKIQAAEATSASASAIHIPVPPPWPASDTGVNASDLSTSSGGRRLRKRNKPTGEEEEREEEDSDGTSGKKQKGKKRKPKDADGRWSKRFTWPDDLHRDFVSAIFDVGLKHSSPSTLLEYMPSHPDITSERIKSHLQKYRLHRIKSKRDFMTAFDNTMEKLGAHGLDSIKSLSDGQVAAHLAYSTIHDKPAESLEDSSSPPCAGQSPQGSQSQQTILLPHLTEEEKRSPIGNSLGYLMGLFFSLQAQLVAHREQQAKNAGDNVRPPVQDVTMWQPAAPTPSGVVGTVTPSTAASQSVATAVSQTTTVTTTGPSTRSNLEENSLMKREMESQMVFQNKMRALKQHELDKYKTEGKEDSAGQTANMGDTTITSRDSDQRLGIGDGELDEQQRARSLSINEDFLNMDDVDEDQLFQFLFTENPSS